MSGLRFLSVRLALYISILFASLILSLAAPWERVPASFIVKCALLTGLIYLGYRILYKPNREVDRMLNLIGDGYTLSDIDKFRYQYSPGAAHALKTLISVTESGKGYASNQNLAQYLALQNQINPHFLYNTLEGIRGEALEGGLENVATMVETLASYFRYSISNTEQLVSLEDEIESIYNYYRIQQYRFGQRIHLDIEFSDGDQELLYKCRLPKITLQPIVENAIIHGIEGKITSGQILIKIESAEKRLRVTVSDDGVGMDENRLREITGKLNRLSMRNIGTGEPERDGIALVNVNNRIRLLFGEEYGLTIYSVPNMGTDILITLPLIIGRAGEKLFEEGNTNQAGRVMFE
ncbi:MAG: histidine kinase [Clostridiales bacterium]|nr:histidine kinase [Clostridiales bacterium]